MFTLKIETWLVIKYKYNIYYPIYRTIIYDQLNFAVFIIIFLLVLCINYYDVPNGSPLKNFPLVTYKRGGETLFVILVVINFLLADVFFSKIILITNRPRGFVLV